MTPVKQGDRGDGIEALRRVLTGDLDAAVRALRGLPDDERDAIRAAALTLYRLVDLARDPTPDPARMDWERRLLGGMTDGIAPWLG